MAIRSERKRRKDGADEVQNTDEGDDEAGEEDGDGKEKRKKERKCPAKKKEEKKGKRKEKRGKKNENEMSGPNSSLKQGKDNKNYEITKLPLNTNLGYYILPSL